MYYYIIIITIIIIIIIINIIIIIVVVVVAITSFPNPNTLYIFTKEFYEQKLPILITQNQIAFISHFPISQVTKLITCPSTSNKHIRRLPHAVVLSLRNHAQYPI